MAFGGPVQAAWNNYVNMERQRLQAIQTGGGIWPPRQPSPPPLRAQDPDVIDVSSVPEGINQQWEELVPVLYEVMRTLVGAQPSQSARGQNIRGGGGNRRPPTSAAARRDALMGEMTSGGSYPGQEYNLFFPHYQQPQPQFQDIPFYVPPGPDAPQSRAATSVGQGVSSAVGFLGPASSEQAGVDRRAYAPGPPAPPPYDPLSSANPGSLPGRDWRSDAFGPPASSPGPATPAGGPGYVPDGRRYGEIYPGDGAPFDPRTGGDGWFYMDPNTGGQVMISPEEATARQFGPDWRNSPAGMPPGGQWQGWTG